MKRLITIVSVLAVATTLSACTNSNTKDNFDNKIINTTPHWDTTIVKFDTWNGNNSSSNPEPTQTAAIITNEVSTEPTQTTDTVDTSTQSDEAASYNFIKLIDKKSQCTLEARIMYLESYKQYRGDLYNSKSYLYSLVPSSENPVSNEQVEYIDGNSYVLGTYTLPKTLGSNIYHKTAVRTFSTPVKILDSSGFAKDELGNYNSDLTLGLPTVVIDVSCDKETKITNELWSNAVKNTKLIFEALPIAEKTN